MSSRLAPRLNRIERRLGFTGPCRTCGGRGWDASIAVHNDEEPDTTGRGCPECGAIHHLTRIILLRGPNDPPNPWVTSIPGTGTGEAYYHAEMARREQRARGLPQVEPN
jgi:hypothetical protein